MQVLENKVNSENRSNIIMPSVPAGKWIKCNNCNKILYKKELVENNYICPECHYYFRISAKERIISILDENSFQELYTDIPDCDPINFPNYPEKLCQIKQNTKLHEAVIVGRGKIGKMNVLIGVCDTQFLMGSMGYVVGEKITRLFELALKEKLPVIIFSCSGGARMQEGIISLMQMAKTASVVKRYSKEELLYISVLTDPTTGGVAASFSMLGDIIIAEPNALIGFAGPRVIEQTIKQKLPNGFQKSEFLLKHGFIDAIIQRPDLKDYLTKILSLHNKRSIKSKLAIIEENTSISILPKDSWSKVLLSRRADRPTSIDYIEKIFDDFIELHGDHETGDDPAIIGGIASIEGISVTVIGHQKGRNTIENVERNFAMAHPEGYRKAIRLMKQAEKFGRPIITFIDTPGAACDIEAEKRGEATAIAKSLFEMALLRVPILSILIGEGGSGGALGIAVANEVWALENATYSILSPEGFASILWKNGERAKEASAVMKMTADELIKLNIIEKIIPENKIATRKDFKSITIFMKKNIISFINRMSQKSSKEVVEMRYARFRNF